MSDHGEFCEEHGVIHDSTPSYLMNSVRNMLYFSKIFDEFCEEHGVIHDSTPSYSPESNGVAERKNRTLTDLVNTMLDTAGLSTA
jgi:hypothetical protein